MKTKEPIVREKNKVRIITSEINRTNYPEVLKQIDKWCEKKESRYICISNVHMVMEAYDDLNFNCVLNNADIATPDGMPLVWCQKKLGFKDAERVDGPELTLRVCKMAMENGYRVGFIGGTQEVLEQLVYNFKQSYKKLDIVYAYSPPYRTLTDSEEEIIKAQINNSGVQILFVGLGCPKQEKWMAAHKNTINCVMIGVGAAFDIHAGVVKRPPVWVRKIGMEWFYRLCNEPGRLWKRYLKQNPRFIYHSYKQILKYRLKLKK